VATGTTGYCVACVQAANPETNPRGEAGAECPVGDVCLENNCYDF
jgi:hypothetical protein